MLFRSRATGQFKSYEPVNIMVYGKDLFSDTPGVIVNSRTLVPVSAILKELGVAYEWKAQTEEVLFAYNGKNIVLKIDSPYAMVNGVKTLLPDSVPPKIMTYKSTTGELVGRTYVPLAFISEMLGLDRSWIAETRTVAINKKAQSLTDAYINIYSYYPEIRFKVTGEVDATTYAIDGADVGGQDKTVIDFQNTILMPPKNAVIQNGIWVYTIKDQIYGIDKIEIAQTSTNPNNTRVTIYQNERRGNKIYYDAAKKEMVVQLVNTVSDVSVEKIFSSDTVVLKSREIPNYNADIKDNQIIVDIIGSELLINNGNYQSLPVNQGKIKSISYTQLDTKQFGGDMYSAMDLVTRMTVELTEKVTYDDFYVEHIDGNLYVYVSENPINNFNYVKQNNESGRLEINLFSAAETGINYDATTRKLSLRIPKDKTDLGLFNQTINDNIVDSFIVTDIGAEYLVDVILAENTSYTKGTSATAVLIQFTNKVIQDSEHKETLIVIDAGHGGKDPGAVGTKTQEKILTLKAATLLQSELEKLGFKVYMTRSTDEYVGLYDRAAMANDLDATLFVSIHINAFTNASVSGIEVLYGNDSMSSDKGLAQSIQKKLVGALGAVDRGVDSRPRLVVLKETQMTSVLCELGFITNAAEQDKLMSESYLKKAAKAMADGIVDFLK